MSEFEVSNKLGEYMSKGWVLTDNPCPAPCCRGGPLLRSPKGQEPVVYYCADCDGPPKMQGGETPSHSSSTVSSTSHGSRPSTPPTEFSSTLSSPTFAPPVETEEMIRRRQQSDRASTEIGKRLLKGWAMLAEECPNTRCYGVPLVRPPKSGGDKDPRKECVTCGTVYLTEDIEGWQRLVPVSSGTSTSQGFHGNPRQPGPSDKGKSVIRNSPQVSSEPRNTLVKDLSNPYKSRAHSHAQVAPLPISTVTMDAPTQALELTLGTLSERLAMACANPNLLDPSTVAVTADAIGKVAHALAQVKQLQHYYDGQSGLV
ncbi:hypothetical protein BU15DRAFT_38825 [Melanogaster broomeanus]|nr:hypothetical protein BU15DRAFT_38825 [Melanogaster broomeanus]